MPFERMRSSNPKKVIMNSSFDTLIQSETSFNRFFATWCGPCKMLGPILKDVKDQMGDGVSIIKIDVDKNQQIAAQYQVRVFLP
jgi:thioredoxin 1